MGSAEAAELSEARRDDLPRRQHRLRQRAGRATPTRSASTCERVIDAANSPAVQPHPPAGRRGRRALHPRLPALLPGGRPRRAPARRGAEVNEAMPAYAVDLLGEALGDLTGARVLILGVAYRGGVKETAFSGAFALRDELTAARRDGRWPPTRSTTTTSCARWASSRGTAAPVDGAVLQADHAEYAAARTDSAAGGPRGGRRPSRARPRALRRGRRRPAADRRRSAQRSQRRDDTLARAAVAVELGTRAGHGALQRGQRRVACRGRRARSTRRRRSRPTPSCRAASRTAPPPGRPPSARRPSRSAPRARGTAAP